MTLGVFGDVVILVEDGKQLIDNDAGVLVIQGVVLGRPVRVAITPVAERGFGLIRAAARIDEYSDHHRNLAAVDQVVHDEGGANISLRSHESLSIVVDHQTGWNGWVV